ncbi:MAG: hypothetical protein MIL41_00480 [Hyphomicrobiales bacterium]|jgi:hypothetical protein
MLETFMPSGRASRASAKFWAGVESFLLDPFARRKGQAIAAASIIGLFLVVWLVHTDRVLLWAQTVAGNWSPPSPPAAQPAQAAAAQPAAPAPFTDFEVSLSGTLAIFLNVAALGLLAKTMVHVLKLQRRQDMQNYTLKTLISMDKNALQNDIVTAFDEVDGLSSDMKATLTRIVNDKFANHSDTIDVTQLREIIGDEVVDKIATGVRNVQFDRTTGAAKIG